MGRWLPGLGYLCRTPLRDWLGLAQTHVIAPDEHLRVRCAFGSMTEIFVKLLSSRLPVLVVNSHVGGLEVPSRGTQTLV